MDGYLVLSILVSRAEISRVVRHCRAAADFAGGGGDKDWGPCIIRLQNVLGAHIARSKNRDEWRRRGGFLYARPSLLFLALHQAHRANHLESKFPGSLNRLHRGSARGTNVVDDHDARALRAKAFNALSRPMLLFRFTYEKTVQFATPHRDGNDDGIGSHRKAADGLRIPPPLADFIEKHLTGQASAFGVKRRGAAIDVVIAGPAGR